MDSLMSLRVFCAVAELKNFTAAADRLGISLPMASKHVMRLEQHIGTRLLNRTRWQVTLTKTGALYFEPIRHLLMRLDEVEAAVRKAAEYGSELI
jgi:DNA-binding transcriptional LysR family regulator